MIQRCVVLAIGLVCLPMAARAGTAPTIVADHEHHPALLIGATQMMFHHEQALLDIAHALWQRAPVYGLVSNRAQAEHLRLMLKEQGLPASAVHPIVVDVQTMWLRDYGPVFARVPGPRGESRVALIDARSGGTAANPDDDSVPRALAEQWHLTHVPVDLWLEGGQILSNGSGLLLVSNALININAERDGIDGPSIVARLQESLPFERAEIVLPLHGEPTGHIDMFMAFLATDLLLVADLDVEEDRENAQRLDDVAHRLAGMPTAAGPLRVVRVATPAASNGLWRSYTNAAFVGDTVLVPSYPDVDPEFDRRAREVFEDSLPDHVVVMVDARSLVARKGALHCVSIPLPREVLSAIVGRAVSTGSARALPLSPD